MRHQVAEMRENIANRDEVISYQAKKLYDFKQSNQELREELLKIERVDEFMRKALKKLPNSKERDIVLIIKSLIS